jgi:hypothetical protein
MRITAIILLCLGVIHSPPVYGQEMKKAKIFAKMKSNAFKGETRITIRILNVPIGHWYRCNFYDGGGEIIASVHHVLRERVPSTNIKVTDPNDISFALCGP